MTWLLRPLLLLASIVNGNMLTLAMLAVAVQVRVWQGWVGVGLALLLDVGLGMTMSLAGDYARLRWIQDHFLEVGHYRLHRIPFSDPLVQCGLRPTFTGVTAFNRLTNVLRWLTTLRSTRGVELDPVNVFYVELMENSSRGVSPAVKSFAGIISPSFVFVRDDPCRGAVPLFQLFHELAHTERDAWVYSPMKYRAVIKAPLLFLLLLPLATNYLGIALLATWLAAWWLLIALGGYESEFEACADRNAMERMRLIGIGLPQFRRIQRFNRALSDAADDRLKRGGGGTANSACLRTRAQFIDRFVEDINRGRRPRAIVPGVCLVDLLLLPAVCIAAAGARTIPIYVLVTLAILLLASAVLRRLYLGVLIGRTMHVDRTVKAHCAGNFTPARNSATCGVISAAVQLATS